MNLDRQQVAREACEYGAITVLDELEGILKADTIDGCPATSERIHVEFYKRIKQLKGEYKGYFLV